MNVVAEASFQAVMEFDDLVSSGVGKKNLISIHFVNIDAEMTQANVDKFRELQQKPAGNKSEKPSKHEDFATGGPGARLLDSSENSDLMNFADSDGTDQDKKKKRQRTLKTPADPFPAPAKLDHAPQNDNNVKRPKLVQDGSGAAKDDKDEDCVICMDKMTQPKALPCGHKFCTDCIRESFEKCQPKCPSCGKLFGIQIGNQPPGTMTVKIIPSSLSGYEGLKTIEITYDIPDGIQNVSGTGFSLDKIEDICLRRF